MPDEHDTNVFGREGGNAGCTARAGVTEYFISNAPALISKRGLWRNQTLW
jgi:hypothetical protein